jgi:hypothetical protein
VKGEEIHWLVPEANPLPEVERIAPAMYPKTGTKKKKKNKGGKTKESKEQFSVGE